MFNKFLDSKIYKSPSVILEINRSEKTIKINQKNKNDWVLFVGGNFKEWEILFNSKTILNENYYQEERINENGLTGCLNFYDIEVKNLTLVYENSKCEDALNIIRSEGILDKVVISNSISDGLDMDFSSLLINNIIREK